MKVTWLIFPFLAGSLLSESEKRLISALVAIDAHGQGNPEAVQSFKQVDLLGPESVHSLLLAMNRANPVADNWIIAAIEQILASSEPALFPAEKIKSFLLDSSNAGSSRRIAFELLQTHRPEQTVSLIPHFLNDPEPSLRREAVAEILAEANSERNQTLAIQGFQKALRHAREAEQIRNAADSLKKRGQSVDLVERMGFITDWQALGPFDNSERSGFAEPYPPESEISVQKSYEGKNGLVQWSSLSTTDPLGKLDLNEKYGEIKEALAYAKTIFLADEDQKVQFRLGSKNAWKIWVNGELLFGRDEYHRGGTRVDQFVLDGHLQKGRNEILVKVLQNEQTQPWTKQWEFCLRVTDPTGKPVKESR